MTKITKKIEEEKEPMAFEESLDLVDGLLEDCSKKGRRVVVAKSALAGMSSLLEVEIMYFLFGIKPPYDISEFAACCAISVTEFFVLLMLFFHYLRKNSQMKASIPYLKNLKEMLESGALVNIGMSDTEFSDNYTEYARLYNEALNKGRQHKKIIRNKKRRLGSLLF
jgi:hypothetical protein